MTYVHKILDNVLVTVCISQEERGLSSCVHCFYESKKKEVINKE